MATVVLEWVSELGWKEQSILFSGLRGPDSPNVPNVKIVGRWMRTISQNNADPTKSYMKSGLALPDELALCDELEFLPCHFVHHLADALAVIAYGHPVRFIAGTAARYHYRIAEELFHFQPETRVQFKLRHRDIPDPQHDPGKIAWAGLEEDRRNAYIDGALERT